MLHQFYVVFNTSFNSKLIHSLQCLFFSIGLKPFEINSYLNNHTFTKNYYLWLIFLIYAANNIIIS